MTKLDRELIELIIDYLLDIKDSTEKVIEELFDIYLTKDDKNDNI